MSRDKHLERIKAIKRASREEMSGIGGKAGVHSDKRERRVRRMGTKEWLEEIEEEMDSEALIPKCPYCGQQMEVWHICDESSLPTNKEDKL